LGYIYLTNAADPSLLLVAEAVSSLTRALLAFPAVLKPLVDRLMNDLGSKITVSW
jgi:hypothetical protein